METFELSNLILYKESNQYIIYDKISHNYAKISGNISPEDLVKSEKVKKLLDSFRGNILEIEQCHITTVYINITNKCNLNCYYCSSNCDSTAIEHIRHIRLDDFSTNVIPLLKIINPDKVILTGGEPLINPDISSIILLLANCINARIYIQTNGYYIETLDDDAFRCIYGINISCNAYFENGISNCNLTSFLNRSIDPDRKKITLSIVLNKLNLSCIQDFVSYASTYNIKMLINFMTALGKGMDYRDVVLNDTEKLKILQLVSRIVLKYDYANETASFMPRSITYKGDCGAKARNFAINKDGDVHLCKCIDDDYVIGNIYVDSPFLIQQKLECISCVRDVFDVDSDDYCKQCHFRYFCGGLCFAVRHYNNTFEYPCLYNKSIIKFLMFFSDKNPIKNISNLSSYLSELLDSTAGFHY